MGANCPWNEAFLTPSWPSWWSWTLPPSFPALSTSWGWFLPFRVSHFDLPGPRYAVAKAQNGNIGDSCRAVWPATQAKSVTLAKVMGVQSQVSKNHAKVPYFGADLGVGSRFGLLRRQKRSKSKFFFVPTTMTLMAWWWAWKNFNFGHSGQSYKRLKFHQVFDILVC